LRLGMAAGWTESLRCGDGLAAVRAIRPDGLTHDEVEKESQQVWEQGCDQNPEAGAHCAAACIGVDVAEAEKPDRQEAAENQAAAEADQRAGEEGIGVREDRSQDESNERAADDESESADPDGIGDGV